MRPAAPLLAAILAVTIVGAAPSVAGAASMEITQHVLDADGHPLLVANTVPDGALATPTWRACAPNCAPAVLATDSVLRPGPTAAGTTFEASAMVDGVSIASRSRPWTGQVASLTPPSLSGELRSGRTVTASPGSWTGGWGDDLSALSFRACTTPAATDCRLMPSPSGTSVVIDHAYAGWFIGAVESRYGREQAFPAIGPPVQLVGVPSTVPAPVPGATVAVGQLVGPVAADVKGQAPQADPAPGLGFTPRVSLRKRQGVVDGRRTVGTIICPARCVAKVVVTQGSSSAASLVVVRKGTRAIRIPRTFDPKRRVRVVVGFEGSDVRARRWVGTLRR